MDNTTIEDFTKAFGQFSNAIETNFKQIDELMKNSMLSDSDRDKIIKASNGLKDSIVNQTPNTIFETLKDFNNDSSNK